ncbi:doublecortin domain-containing protein 2-like [Glandiceps talaboti]
MTTTRAEPVTAKSIRVYKNGDNFYAGRKFVVNQKQIRNFDAFMSQVTLGIRASNAVRNIYTPVHGHRVGGLETLESGNAYVAGGVEKFKKIDYSDIGSKKATQRPRTLEITPVRHSIYRDKIGARWREWVVQPCSIHVYRNGDEKNPAIRLLLPRKALQSWDMVLDYVTDRVNLRTGAVRRLYSLDGRPIVDLKDIQNGEYYVAVGTDKKFKKVAYGQDISSPVNSPRSVRTLPPLNRPRPPPQRLTQTQPTKYSNRRIKDQDSPKATTNNHNKRQKKVQKKSEEKQEAETVFHSKPTIPKRVSKDKENEEQIKYEDDPDSVFKAKDDREETKGAKEVKEDKDTAVDLPIDQVAAEEVDEEEIQPADDEPEIANDDDVKAAESETKSQPDDQWNRRVSPVRSPTPSQMSNATKSPVQSPTRVPSTQPPTTSHSEVREDTPAKSPTPEPKSPTPEPKSPTPAPKSPTPSEKSNTTLSRPKSAPVSSATSSKHSLTVTSPPKSPARSPSPAKDDEDEIKEEVEEEKPADDEEDKQDDVKDNEDEPNNKPADDDDETKVDNI